MDKPELCFLSAYFATYETAVTASRQFSELLQKDIYIYEEKNENEVLYYITSNVKCAGEYIEVISLQHNF